MLQNNVEKYKSFFLSPRTALQEKKEDRRKGNNQRDQWFKNLLMISPQNEQKHSPWLKEHAV